jgi:hypothetical protein
MNLQDKQVKDCTEEELRRAIALKNITDLTWRKTLQSSRHCTLLAMCERANNHGYKYFIFNDYVYIVNAPDNYTNLGLKVDDVK